MINYANSNSQSGGKSIKIPNNLIIYLNTNIPGFQKIKYEPFMSIPQLNRMYNTIYFDPYIKLTSHAIRDIPSEYRKLQFFDKGLFFTLKNRVLSGDSMYSMYNNKNNNLYDSQDDISEKFLFKNDTIKVDFTNEKNKKVKEEIDKINNNITLLKSRYFESADDGANEQKYKQILQKFEKKNESDNVDTKYQEEIKNLENKYHDLLLEYYDKLHKTTITDSKDDSREKKLLNRIMKYNVDNKDEIKNNILNDGFIPIPLDEKSMKDRLTTYFEKLKNKGSAAYDTDYISQKRIPNINKLIRDGKTDNYLSVIGNLKRRYGDPLFEDKIGYIIEDRSQGFGYYENNFISFEDMLKRYKQKLIDTKNQVYKTNYSDKGLSLEISDIIKSYNNIDDGKKSDAINTVSGLFENNFRLPLHDDNYIFGYGDPDKKVYGYYKRKKIPDVELKESYKKIEDHIINYAKENNNKSAEEKKIPPLTGTEHLKKVLHDFLDESDELFVSENFINETNNYVIDLNKSIQDEYAKKQYDTNEFVKKFIQLNEFNNELISRFNNYRLNTNRLLETMKDKLPTTPTHIPFDINTKPISVEVKQLNSQDWKSGEIDKFTRQNRGSQIFYIYNIIYHDKTYENNVPLERIRIKIKKDDLVQVSDPSISYWYPGKITKENDNGTYDIDVLRDSSVKEVKNVPREMIRVKQENIYFQAKQLTDNLMEKIKQINAYIEKNNKILIDLTTKSIMESKGLSESESNQLNYSFMKKDELKKKYESYKRSKSTSKNSSDKPPDGDDIQFVNKIKQEEDKIQKLFDKIIDPEKKSMKEKEQEIVKNQYKFNKIVDTNIHYTLDTLFKENSILYLNNKPFTIFSYKWELGNWKIDTNNNLPSFLSSGQYGGPFSNYMGGPSEQGTSPYMGSPYGRPSIVINNITNASGSQPQRLQIAERELDAVPRELIKGSKYTKKDFSDIGTIHDVNWKLKSNASSQSQLSIANNSNTSRENSGSYNNKYIKNGDVGNNQTSNTSASTSTSNLKAIEDSMKSKYNVQMIENKPKVNTTRKQNVLLLTGGNGCWSSRRTRRNRGSFERKQIYQSVGGGPKRNSKSVKIYKNKGEEDTEKTNIIKDKFISHIYYQLINTLYEFYPNEPYDKSEQKSYFEKSKNNDKATDTTKASEDDVIEVAGIKINKKLSFDRMYWINNKNYIENIPPQNIQIRQTISDGNCFFHALVLGLINHNNDYYIDNNILEKQNLNFKNLIKYIEELKSKLLTEKNLDIDIPYKEDVIQKYHYPIIDHTKNDIFDYLRQNPLEYFIILSKGLFHKIDTINKYYDIYKRFKDNGIDKLNETDEKVEYNSYLSSFQDNSPSVKPEDRHDIFSIQPPNATRNYYYLAGFTYEFYKNPKGQNRFYEIQKIYYDLTDERDRNIRDNKRELADIIETYNQRIDQDVTLPFIAILKNKDLFNIEELKNFILSTNYWADHHTIDLIKKIYNLSIIVYQQIDEKIHYLETQALIQENINLYMFMLKSGAHYELFEFVTKDFELFYPKKNKERDTLSSIYSVEQIENMYARPPLYIIFDLFVNSFCYQVVSKIIDNISAYKDNHNYDNIVNEKLEEYKLFKKDFSYFYDFLKNIQVSNLISGNEEKIVNYTKQLGNTENKDNGKKILKNKITNSKRTLDQLKKSIQNFKDILINNSSTNEITKKNFDFILDTLFNLPANPSSFTFSRGKEGDKSSSKKGVTFGESTVKTYDSEGDDGDDDDDDDGDGDGGYNPPAKRSSPDGYGDSIVKKSSVSTRPEQPRQEEKYDSDGYDSQLKANTNISFIVFVDLVLYPGKEIPPHLKGKLTCNMNYEDIRKDMAEIYKSPYVPKPLDKPEVYKYVQPTLNRGYYPSSRYNNNQVMINNGVYGGKGRGHTRRLIIKNKNKKHTRRLHHT